MLAEAWKEEAWATLVWLAMTTGARSGELCALPRRHLDVEEGVLTIELDVAGSRSRMRAKETKTHQKRRVALDERTVAVLREHINRQDRDAAALGLKLDGQAFLFSLDPDCERPLVPDSVPRRFDRIAERPDIATLHTLRHRNATELLAAGVDLRIVAGRLGHGGGGTTTLKVYAAWGQRGGQARRRCDR